jgi:hypothetical protein
MMYYAITIFLSAFLLFQVQPMIGKYILPWFGGTPAVWSTTMLFFQMLLTGGYAYAAWLVNKLSSRQQGIVHLALLGASASVMLVTGLVWASPILPDATWKPQSVETPVWDIFKILAVSVGLPYLLLATNSPLMQAWFNRAFPGHSPYRLYALSNIGSLLALITYPTLIEPSLPLSMQGNVWSLGYGAFVILAAYGASKTMWRMPVNRAVAESNSFADDAPHLITRVLWLALAACASALLLAITNQITQEVAVIPFLWVIPLTIYLLTFILCFDSDRWYSRTAYTFALFVITAIYVYVLASGPQLALVLQIGAYGVLLFICCMICNGELVRLKPHPRYLTQFYLMISIGGAIGGIAVSLVAPYIFKGYWELPLGVLLCAILLLIVTFFNRLPSTSLHLLRITTIVLSGVIVLLASVSFLYIKATLEVPFAARNFYGVLRVIEINPHQPDQRAYLLAHGATSHGFQYVPSDKRRLPNTYFTESSGIGLTLLNFPKPAGTRRIGVLGLGVGILATYTQPGDTIRFYEINPEVIRLAEGAEGYFSFLSDARGQVSVVAGDARLLLEQELVNNQPQHFDLLVVDTFNSDSIPVHLITRQAMAIYLQHLQPDGVLAFHISNNYLDLQPVVYGLADEFQMDAAFIESPGVPGRGTLSLWMLVTRNHAFLNQPAITSQIIPRATFARVRLWTDDYSNPFQLLR